MLRTISGEGWIRQPYRGRHLDVSSLSTRVHFSDPLEAILKGKRRRDTRGKQAVNQGDMDMK